MRLLVTGGSGEIGRPALRALRAAGHEVRATARSAAAAAIVRSLGATPVSLDLLDDGAVRDAAAEADGVLHLATAIPPSAEMGDLARWEANDALRARTTAALADGTRAGGGVLVLQSYFGVAAPRGDAWIDEDPGRPPRWSGIDVMDSMRVAEERALDAGAVVLRFGSLYSPSSEQLQAQLAALSAGAAAIAGEGTNFWPFVASEDAGRAVAAALALAPGTYDVGDDEPVTLGAFWAMAAHVAGVPVPPHADVTGHPMAPILLGSWRTSNRAFRAASGWAPQEAPSVLAGWPRAAAQARDGAVALRPLPAG